MLSLNLENRNLNRRNLRSMLKISYAACPCLSQLISAQFTLKMCLAARNRQKIHNSYGVQGHPRSLNSAPIKSQCMTLLVINNNLSPISYCYWDTATYWLKIANFPTPSHLAPSLGVTPFEFTKKLYGCWIGGGRVGVEFWGGGCKRLENSMQQSCFFVQNFHLFLDTFSQ